MRLADDPGSPYRNLDRPSDLKIAHLATRQHGVVAMWQLSGLGFTKAAVFRRARGGRLHRLHRGVYAVGHLKVGARSRWMAAVLACGPEAVLSFRAAAALWDVRPMPSGPVDVTAPGRTRRGQRGIRLHSVHRIEAEDRTVLDGIPVTSIYRTLLDLASILGPQQLRLAVEAAVRRDLLDGRRLDAFLARNARRRGALRLRRAVGEVNGAPPLTRSGLEDAFLTLVRRAGLPAPQVNVDVCGIVVDFFWPTHRLVVEVDSFRWHKTRRTFEEDRTKSNILQVAGHRCLRFTDARIDQDPRGVLQELRLALAARVA